jgi:hypothetical protein
MSAAILLPAAFGLFRAHRLLLAFAHHDDAIGGNAKADKVILRGEARRSPSARLYSAVPRESACPSTVMRVVSISSANRVGRQRGAAIVAKRRFIQIEESVRQRLVGIHLIHCLLAEDLLFMSGRGAAAAVVVAAWRWRRWRWRRSAGGGGGGGAGAGTGCPRRP